MRAQIDYLQRLPNDWEKQQALKRLPPSLPQTYIRIFEQIDSTYPVQTTKYIRRLLRWLVLVDSKKKTNISVYNSYTTRRLSFDALCQAICIDNDHDWPSSKETPKLHQIQRWLGCLVRETYMDTEIELSHFTVKEFLVLRPEEVISPVARRYLVDSNDQTFFADVCMTYLMHDHFRDIQYSTWDEIDLLIMDHPFYRYVANVVFNFLAIFDDSDIEADHPIRRFFAHPPCSNIQLWQTCLIYTWSLNKGDGRGDGKNRRIDLSHYALLAPLHFASFAGLRHQVQKLLLEGVSPDVAKDAKVGITALHLAIASGSTGNVYLQGNHLKILDVNKLDISDRLRDPDSRDRHQRSLHTANLLVNFGADVNRQFDLEKDDVITTPGRPFFESGKSFRTTPFVLAICCGNWELAGFLLAAGARWDATAHEDGKSYHDYCSVQRLLENFPNSETAVRLAVEHRGRDELTEDFEESRTLGYSRSSYVHPISYSNRSDVDPQYLFVNAFSNKRWRDVHELVTNNPNLELDCMDEQGKRAVDYAANCKNDELRFLLEHGANPKLCSRRSWTPFNTAAARGRLENMRCLMEHGVDIEHRITDGWTPLHLAVHYGHSDAVQLLLDSEADINAVLDDGFGALHIAINEGRTEIFSYLVQRKINPGLCDNYGSTPLHQASLRGVVDQVECLLSLGVYSQDSLDHSSLDLGTPLYTAAEWGHCDIVKVLLQYGASINKCGVGNKLGSALMIACAGGRSEVVKLLLSRGAAVEVEGSRFGSAAGTARAFRQKKILGILEEHARTPIQEEDESIRKEDPGASVVNGDPLSKAKKKRRSKKARKSLIKS